MIQKNYFCEFVVALLQIVLVTRPAIGYHLLLRFDHSQATDSVLMGFKMCDQGCTFTQDGVNLNLGHFTCQSEGVVIEKCHIVGPSRSLDAEKHKLIIKNSL